MTFLSLEQASTGRNGIITNKDLWEAEKVRRNEALDFQWAEDHIDETEMPDSELTYYPEQH